MVHPTPMWKHDTPNSYVEAWYTKLLCGSMILPTPLWKHDTPNSYVAAWYTQLLCGSMLHPTPMWKHDTPNSYVEAWYTQLLCGSMIHQTPMWKHDTPNSYVEAWYTQLLCGSMILPTPVWKHLYTQLLCRSMILPTPVWKHDTPNSHIIKTGKQARLSHRIRSMIMATTENLPCHIKSHSTIPSNSRNTSMVSGKSHSFCDFRYLVNLQISFSSKQRGCNKLPSHAQWTPVIMMSDNLKCRLLWYQINIPTITKR